MGYDFTSHRVLELMSMSAAKPTLLKLKRLAGWALLAGGLVMAAACGDKNVYAPPPPPKVTVSQPVRQPVTDYLEFTGNAQAINTAQLRARVPGYLEKVYFQGR